MTTDLGTLGGNTSSATAINAGGTIVGYSTVSASPFSKHAFIYQNGAMTDLGSVVSLTPVTTFSVVAYGINDSGTVVGWGMTSAGNTAFATLNGSMLNLNDLIADPQDWSITAAWSINNSGQIAAVAKNLLNSTTEAVILTPISSVPEASTCFAGVAVGALALIGWWQSRGRESGSKDLAAVSE